MTNTTMKEAKAKVMHSKPLRESLKDWFNHKGCCPFNEVEQFGDWVDLMLDMMRVEIDNSRLETAENLFKALKVQSMGDPIALKCARELDKKKVQNDIDCYVEEGKVYASVWIKHMVVSYANELAEEVAAKFRENGYSADLWHDMEDSSEVTVCASIDFDKYVELQTKGGR